MKRLAAAALAVVLGFLFVAANGFAARLGEVQSADDVDLLLVLAADVSNSVDAREHLLQREGYASALVHPRVLSAITGSGKFGRIAVCYIEWSGPDAQDLIVDWTMIAGRTDAEEFSARLREAPRLFNDRTSISGAIDFAMTQFWRSPFSARRKVIDISGDGTNTSGRPVAEARDEAIKNGAVINGLVILSNEPATSVSTHTNPHGGLKHYFETHVIGGPGAFAFTAEGFETFGQSIISKLIKEIASAPPVGPALKRLR
ncbi:MAG: hypothetical protein RLZ98_2220 [Pseudomonadota bacterium]|jgi:hypothetical protein